MTSESSDSLRVLMTADTVGGVWQYTMQLCHELLKYNVTVRLATMGGPLTVSQQKEVWRLPNVSLCESVFALEWMDDPWGDIARASEWLWEIEQDFQPDLIHFNNYAFAGLPFSAPKIVVGHSCVKSWWRSVKCSPLPSKWARYERVVQRGLDAADRIVAPTQWMASELDLLYSLNQSPLVIYNGRCEADYAAAEKEAVIFSLGRVWDEAKNLRTLSDIARELPWPVVVAGETRSPDGKEFVATRARLLGQINGAESAAWLGRAAIYAAPALYEPFGLSILEAALSGCALVLGDIGSLRELWEGAALFVPPADKTALRDRCLELVAEPSLRERLAQAAAERARRYSAEQMGKAYAELYSIVARKAEHTFSA